MLLPLQGTNSFGLDARLVADDPYMPLELVRLAWPPRVQWRIDGTSPEGFMPNGAPARVTVYSGVLAGGGRRCASFSLIPPPRSVQRWSFLVTSAERSLARGTHSGSRTVLISVPLFARASPRRQSAELAIYASGQPVVIDGVPIGTKLAFFSVGRCPAAHQRQRPSR
jgi:hypothetical protein